MKKLIKKDVVTVPRISADIKDGLIHSLRKKNVKFEFKIFKKDKSYEVILRQPDNHKNVGIMNVIEQLATKVYKNHLWPRRKKFITWFQDSPYDEGPRKVTMNWSKGRFCDPQW